MHFNLKINTFKIIYFSRNASSVLHSISTFVLSSDHIVYTY